MKMKNRTTMKTKTKGEKRIRKILHAYRQILTPIWREAKGMVILSVALAVLNGLLPPCTTIAMRHVLDDGMQVARGNMTFAAYTPWLILLAATMLAGPIIMMLTYSYCEPRSQLILNTSYKGEMLKKLNRARYAHFEDAASREIIDKATSRAMNSARHLYPMYLVNTLSGLVASVGLLWQLGQAAWYLSLGAATIFAVETWINGRFAYSVYEEMESYWPMEKKAGVLGNYLKKRSTLTDEKLNDAADYLIGKCVAQRKERNQAYEKFYFKHLRRQFTGGNIARLGQLLIVAALVWLYRTGDLTVGAMTALAAMVFQQLFDYMNASTIIARFAHFHIATTDFYDKLFDLSEEKEGSGENTGAGEIEFRNVWFRYPSSDPKQTNPWILKGVSFRVRPGEKLSLVGENGEGKSTLIKLLLGLFDPDRGEILLDGKNIASYSRQARNQMFAPVFQDFNRYALTRGENIAVGNIDRKDQAEEIRLAAEKAGVEGDMDQLLGREFDGGVDLSGGQWQRIAIARAIMGNKPVLLLDEPTSQLDPMAESRLYEEFHALCQGKTALFITHRLGSTKITDRILVLSGGKVAEEGSHARLMARGGIYAKMYEAQKQWYERGESA